MIALATVALLLVAGLLLQRRWLIVTVRGNSMAPTLADGERLLARRVRPGARSPRRGELVVFRPASAQDEEVPLRIKRVAAVEGEPLPAWFAATAWANGHTHVPRGLLVISGDNPVSQDSRQLGFVDARSVLAVARGRAPAK